MAKIRICKEAGCRNAGTTNGYCRLHYLKNWKKIKAKKRQTAAERLNKYIELLVKKHPDRYVEVLKKEIRSGRFESAPPGEFNAEMEDIYRIFNDPGYEGEIERLIRNLKVEGKF